MEDEDYKPEAGNLKEKSVLIIRKWKI